MMTFERFTSPAALLRGIALDQGHAAAWASARPIGDHDRVHGTGVCGGRLGAVIVMIGVRGPI
jgi:hypothetical protein